MGGKRLCAVRVAAPCGIATYVVDSHGNDLSVSLVVSIRVPFSNTWARRRSGTASNDSSMKNSSQAPK